MTREDKRSSRPSARAPRDARATKSIAESKAKTTRNASGSSASTRAHTPGKATPSADEERSGSPRKPSARKPSARKPSARKPAARKQGARKQPAPAFSKARSFYEAHPGDDNPTSAMTEVCHGVRESSNGTVGDPSSSAATEPFTSPPASSPLTARSLREGALPPPPAFAPSEHPRSSYRPRTVPPEEQAILITGICGRLGRLLARKLHRETRVIGIDRRPFRGKPKDIVHYQLDMRRKKMRDVFRSGRVRAVVHLGVLHDPRASDKEHHAWNVVAFQKLLEYLSIYAVDKLVVLSSANVYGPHPDNPQFLTEEAPLLGAQRFRGIRDLVEMDMLAQSFFWRHPATETVILRPCHILGAVNNAPSNYLRLEHPLTLMGFDPMVQVIHERDVVEALALALRPGVRGIFNLKGPGELPLSKLFSMLGREPRPVPTFLAESALSRMWRYRLTSFPPPELDHIRFVCMVDDQRARETLGFHPRYGVEETVHAVDSDR